MRRKSYFYNQVQSLRRFFRRQVKKVICMAAVSATILTSVPFVTYTDVYAKARTTQEEMKALSIPTDDKEATIYDLSNDDSLISEKTIVDYYGNETTIKVIEINITEDGSYVITGSNRIDDTLIDTHIIVAEGVKANITFDGAKIENSTRYVSHIGYSVEEVYNPVFPVMDIFGDATIFVRENSELTSAAAQENPVIRVTGEMILEENESDADAALKLTVGKEVDDSGKRMVRSDMYAVSGYADGVRSHGSMTVKGGNLDITGGIDQLERFTMKGGAISFTCESMDEPALVANDITIDGGNCKQFIDASEYPNAVIFEGKRNIQFRAGTIEVNRLDEIVRSINTFSSPNTRITGGKLKLDDQIVIEDTMDAYGNQVNLFDLTGLPENENVAAINGQPVDGLQTTEAGELKTVSLTYSSNLIQMENGDLYKYDYQYDDENETELMVADETTDPAVYEVPLKFEEEDGTLIEQKKVYLPEGFEMQDYFDGNNFYQYFNESGEQYPEVTINNNDALTLKKMCTVTLNGEPYTGDVLPKGSVYVWKWKSEDSYGLWYYTFYPGDPVPSGKNIELESVPSIEKNDKWYVILESPDDIDRIKIMTELDPTINILLETDLDFSGDESVYNLLGTVYYGDFDGNRHTISNAKLYAENWYALTERNYGTIKNVHFENITNQTNPMSCRTGVICEENYGTVENCSVKDSVIRTLAREYKETGEVSPYDKAKEYSALVGGNFGTIRGCFASGVTFEGDGVTYPLTHEFPNSIIENTYYEAEAETRDDTGRTKGQFESGEVCSLLNQGVTDGSQYWHQNIENDAETDDVPVADDSHGTVYKVYTGCSLRGYSNNALHDTPSHEVDYTVKDNVLTGECKADPLHTVTMTLTAEDAVCDGTEHKAALNKTYSDAWGEAEVDTEIVYTRDGEPTTDLTSAGTIKASVTAGEAVIEVTYTIKAAATPAPAVTPSASPAATPTASPAATPSASPKTTPTAKPEVTPSTSPAATPSASPKTTPTVNPPATPAATLPPATDPVVLPPANPSADDKSTPAPDNKPVIEPGATKAPAAAKTPQAVGSKIKIKKRGTFKVIKSSGKKPEVELTKLFLNKKDKYVSIPKTVKVNGVTYKVTAIAKRAFAGNKNLKAVVIGKNIKEIGVMAFYNCPNLKTVTIKSTQLKAKTVGAKAFAKIYEKASVQIPKSKKTAYTKWLKDRGIGGKQKIVTD